MAFMLLPTGTKTILSQAIEKAVDALVPFAAKDDDQSTLARGAGCAKAALRTGWKQAEVQRDAKGRFAGGGGGGGGGKGGGGTPGGGGGGGGGAAPEKPPEPGQGGGSKGGGGRSGGGGSGGSILAEAVRAIDRSLAGARRG